MCYIFDHAKYLTKDEFDEIYNHKQEFLDKIRFKEIEDGNFLEQLINNEIDLKYWIREFNNRSFDLSNTYAILINYYNMGIPDKEWYIYPENKGQSVQYFPHFEDKHYAYLYWFGFYMDSFYTRFFGLIDTIYHILNVKYQLEVPEKLGFNKEVSDKLRKYDSDLVKYLNDVRKYDTYIKVSEFRNNITHNYRPNQITSGVNREKRADGSIIIDYGVGDYTTTEEFVENIEKGIELLAKIVDDIREKIEN